MIRFVKPTKRRLVWSFLAVAVACCLLAGIAVCVGLIANHDGSEPITAGEYVRLAALCLTFYGPVYLVIAWPVSVPVVGALTALVAYLRIGEDHAAVRNPDASPSLPD